MVITSTFRVTFAGKISPIEKDESNSEPEPYDSGEMVDQEEDEESEKVNDED